MNKKINIYFMLVLSIISMFYPLLNVRAEGVAAKLKSNAPDSLALRSAPTSKNSDIIDAIGKNEIFYILDENKIAGDGCNSGWLKLKYNDKEGYACSTYITTDLTDPYDRPWNTPKKAIIGGAKFIGGSYISKGQFTSYLKKFNVNPNGSYAIYNHLYQANIEAPKSEAASSSNSYIKNNAFDLPFTFSIPVYESMQDSYLHPTGWKANLGTTDETDDGFENMIKDFPDSYKPYLRQLHKEHNNWTFIPMNTGVTIEEAADMFKLTGAIQSTDKRLVEVDSDGNIVATNEKNWYRPKSETVRFYLDPRNFLNETYVFMFENLGYLEVDESVIQGVLDRNNLIKGKDEIDDQMYASIFKEAGKEANVNPVYLASLSIIEVGSSSFNVSGQEFEYQGVTYSGLFNFYNIGASSSAENPVKAGMVWASGGLCQICATYTPSEGSATSDPTPVPVYDINTSLSKINAKISGSIIHGFEIGTTVDSLKSKDSEINYNDSGIIKTGQKITFPNGSTYTVVLYGDLSGDGLVNSADLLKMRQHLLGKSILSSEFLEAAKINGNDTINSANLLKLRQYLLGKTNISQ